jgi:hypothetical protein
MFYLFQMYVAANALCCKCSMRRCGGAGRVVPACAGSKADVAIGACIP